MKGKELKYLSRKELIEVLYEMKKREIALTKELEETKAKLEDKELKFKNAGNLAEAAMAMSGIFESAQKAADEYLALVKANNPIAEEEKPAEEKPEEKPTEEPENEANKTEQLQVVKPKNSALALIERFIDKKTHPKH